MTPPPVEGPVMLPRDRFGRSHELGPFEGGERLRGLDREVAGKRERVMALVVELEDLRVALRRTRLAFYVRVGDLYVELEELDLEIRKEGFRKELEGLPGMDDEAIERLTAAKFREGTERLGSLRGEERDSRAEGPRVERMAALAGETVRSIKQLYRKLARRFHPDLRETDRNRAFFEKTMARLNECYHNLDLQGMLDIQDGVSITLIDVDEGPAERLRRLERISARLDQIEADARRELAELRGHELYEIMVRIERGREQGEDVLAELEEDLRRRVGAKREEFASLGGAGAG